MLPGDHLVKVTGLTENELISLCREMETTAAKEALEMELPAAEEQTRRRSTRTKNNKKTSAAVTCPNLEKVFRSE